jgi:hypothetical protein
MFSHLAAFVAGIVVATIGIVPVAKMADTGVQKIQETVREVAQ